MLHRLRLAAAVGAVTLALGTSIAPAQAAEPNPYAFSSARWLQDQLVHGGAQSYGGFDGGLSLDILFALHGLGVGAAAQGAILGAEKDNITNPPDFPYLGGADKYAGAYGKLASAVQLSGEDATSFAGVDLIGTIESLVDGDGDDAGRVKDESAWGDYSNTIGQSFDARALANAGSGLADEVGAYLLKQQCSNGAFRQTMDDTPCTAGGDVDTTALVVTNLLNAEPAAIPGQTQAINKGVAYLVKAQKADGSFVGNGVKNSNTTGLAGSALDVAGKRGAAANSAVWLLGLQVRDAAAEGTKLADELGAVAYSKADLAAGYKNGRGSDTESKWARATSQAALGLNALAPAKKLGLNAPNGKLKAGKQVKVTGKGLLAGERWTLYVNSKKVATGLANGKGGFKVKVKVPRGTQAALKATGSRDIRVGTDTIKIAPVKKAAAKKHK